MEDFQVGDIVVCDCPGSWTHGKTGTIVRLNVVSSDEIRGHQLQMDGCQTIVQPENLRRAAE